ncbi:MAG: hypothetical protein ACRDBG_12640 [Waterburya sp.]
MATSNITTQAVTRDSIIDQALRIIGAVGDWEVPSALQISLAAPVLNNMVDAFVADGMPLWKRSELTIPFSSFTLGSILIGPGQTINQPTPLVIIDAYRQDNLAGGNRVPLEPYTLNQFQESLSITTQGAPNIYTYEYRNLNGRLRIWPNPDTYWNTNGVIVVTQILPFQTTTIGTHDLDFPPYWTEALIFGLATRLGPRYGLPLNDLMSIKQMAKEAKENAESIGHEYGSLFLSRDYNGF